MKDFFISYNKADRDWAEWIAWTLEEAHYSVIIQAWDLRPGGNFVREMHEAAAGTRRTIAALSEDYLSAVYTLPEWAAAFARDPQGQQRVLIPVRVRECTPEGLLASIIRIDLVGRSEEQAREELLEGLKERAKPDKAPAFPAAERVMPNPVQFPGTSESNVGGSSEAAIPSNLPTGIPFFTGREDVLHQLHETLKASGATALRQAISGLGGIGKTQTAIEYAHRHRDEYKALLWAVAESRESLTSGFVDLARVLDLPEKNLPDQTITVRAVRRWLETSADWLLILDNADDPRIAEEFLPETFTGHLLLTSRESDFDVLGILNPVELDEMTPEDARNFLMNRTGRPELEPAEAQAVEQLAEELDYLPLALEQAGAYIKELRGRFQDYLVSFHQRGLKLLEKGHPSGKYRESVGTTWSLNFQQVEEKSKPSADLLRASAFLNPDRVPLELIGKGAAELGPQLSSALANVDADPLALDEVLQPLIQYSLIRRDREARTYNIHRLVQTVLKDGMNEATEKLWAERVVKAMALVFPDVDELDPSQWGRIEHLLPHAQVCAELINKWNLEFQEAPSLLNLVGRYLHLRGRLSETEPFYTASLAIRKKILGPEDPDVATSLHNRAWLYYDQGKYAEAEQLLLEALAIREKTLGAEHPEVAVSLDKLAGIYKERGQYVEAYRIFRRALDIREEVYDPEHPSIATSLSRLAGVYISQGKYAEAEPLINRAIEIREKTLGQKYYEIASDLGELAAIYKGQGRLAEAESLYLRSIALEEEIFGENYPALAVGLNNLARYYIDEHRYAEAEVLLNRSLRISETELGADHPDTAHTFSAFAYLYREQGKHAEAESYYLRAIAIREKLFGRDHPHVAQNLVGLGRLYLIRQRYAQGEPLLKRAIPVLKKAYGAEHSNVVNAMFTHAVLLKGMNRKGEAQRLEGQAKKIRARLNKKKAKR